VFYNNLRSYKEYCDEVTKISFAKDDVVHLLAYYLKKILEYIVYEFAMESFWFSNPNYWFANDACVDKIIVAKFGHLLTEGSESESVIEMILRWDQLPRHMFRDNAPMVEFYLQKALAVVGNLTLEYFMCMEPEHLAFALLPWRHTRDPVLIYKALIIVWMREEHPMLNRFLKSAYERCPMVGARMVDFTFTLDGDGSFTHILEYSGSDELRAGSHGSHARLFKSESEKDIVVSLSGGVDSMVASWSLRGSIKAAVHINYGNRPTSDAEAAFVTWWCGEVLNVPCFVRRISEIQRGPCMAQGLRSTYESYTRNVRYFCYQEFGSVQIVMGHNKDDTLENIFTNIASKNKLGNLNGMTAHSVQDGIHFWRPMLEFTKSDIFEFARANGIPYLPCSTPTWSQRGQIRASVVPVLDKWHPEFVDGLYTLSREVSELDSMAQAFVNGVAVEADGSFVLTNNKLCVSAAFWKLMFKRLQVSFKTRSLENMLQRFRQGQGVIVCALNKTTMIKRNDLSFSIYTIA